MLMLWQKSDIYWPRKEKERYGSLTIHLVDEEKQSEWITRHFYFEKVLTPLPL